MALIHGSNGLCPCLICLVPAGSQHNPSRKWELHDMNETKGLVKAAIQGKHSQWEPLLKEKGLRKVEVSQ